SVSSSSSTRSPSSSLSLLRLSLWSSNGSSSLDQSMLTESFLRKQHTSGFSEMPKYGNRPQYKRRITHLQQQRRLLFHQVNFLIGRGIATPKQVGLTNSRLQYWRKKAS